MKCPQCSNEIPDISKFCNECGASLSGPATTVGASSLSAADHATLLQKYIPPELAKKILSAGKQIESERRLVTVMFADVSGFTAMSEKLDAEEVSSVLNDCFKGLISIVYKYEGVIDKFIGDEIMAIFGAPLTHENDPERAVRCSMEMMDYMERFNSLSPVSLPEPLGLHISMNTGMVVAGNVGSDLRMNYSVIGDTVNLGSRLKHVAERGEIVISEDTYRIVSSLVNTEEPRLVEIKGKSAPAKVYRIISLKSGVEPGTRVSQKSPIVGRDQEISQLKKAIQQVLLKKEQRFFIRGEAGVGKTRLKLELVQHAKSAGITVYEGKCSSFEASTPYYLWTTLLKDILRLKADTGESETRKRLHDMLQILSLEKHEPYLATLLSLRYEEILLEEDQERKRKIFESLKEFIRALSSRKPSLFLLEDVHWIDRFSQDLLNYLFGEKELAPAMFVPLFRDEYSHSKELIAKGGTLIDLNCLTKPDAQKLMCARLQVENIPGNLAELIYKRSEGNPFFLEELVKTLLDKNVVAVKNQKLEIIKTDFEAILPETVQGVIMARIDRLEDRLKDVLYGASVIGREFDKSLLKEIMKKKEAVDPSLAELLSVELILEKEETKELAYLFKHYLIQEVAYNTILQKKRRELHKLIAQAIEKVYAEKLKDFYELLSFHYEKAEDWGKAAEYLSRAGNKARETFTKEESNGFVERTDAAKAMLLQRKGEQSTTLLIYRFVFGILFLEVFGVGVGAILTPVISALSRDLALWQIALVEVLGIFYLFLTVYGGYYFYQVLRPRPKTFLLFEDRVESILSNGATFTIPFSDISFFHFYDTKKNTAVSRLFRYRLSRETSSSVQVNIKMFSQRLNPASFGFGAKKGEIHIRKREGLVFNSIRTFLKPWKFTVLAQRDIALTPADPHEFYDQLVTAYERWSRKDGTGRPKARKQPVAEPQPSPEQVPLLTLKPTYGFVSTLVSLHIAWYSTLLVPLLQFLILRIVKSEHPELSYYQLYFTKDPMIAIIGCFSILLFVLGVVWNSNRRKGWRGDLYLFYRDRFAFHRVGGNPVDGFINLADIVDIQPLGKWYRRLFKHGDILVKADTILQFHPATGLAESGMILPNIPDPEAAVRSVRDLIKKDQTSGRS